MFTSSVKEKSCVYQLIFGKIKQSMRFKSLKIIKAHENVIFNLPSTLIVLCLQMIPNVNIKCN